MDEFLRIAAVLSVSVVLGGLGLFFIIRPGCWQRYMADYYERNKDGWLEKFDPGRDFVKSSIYPLTVRLGGFALLLAALVPPLVLLFAAR